MSKILIGRYLPGNSIIHQLDSRGKLIATIYFIIIIFLANNWASYLVITLFTLLTIWATGLKAKVFWDGVKPLIWLIFFTSLLQLFFSTGGKVYWHWYFLAITSLGISNAIYIFLRFTLIILFSTVLTITTMPLQIADALSWIMLPLKLVRVPVDKIALVISIALRFVPTLFDQTLLIMNAQRSRGADFNSGGLIKRAKAITPLLIPLFINSLERALDLSVAMESRGYRGTEGRSRYRVLRWTKYDWINLLAFVVLTALLLVTRSR